MTVTATLLMEYSSTPGTYIDLTSLVGTNVYVAVKADANSAISTTNPEMQVTGGYLESLDVVNVIGGPAYGGRNHDHWRNAG